MWGCMPGGRGHSGGEAHYTDKMTTLCQKSCGGGEVEAELGCTGGFEGGQVVDIRRMV